MFDHLSESAVEAETKCDWENPDRVEEENARWNENLILW